MKEIVINKNDSGQRLDRFLIKAFPMLNYGLIQKLVRKKRIKINNSRCQGKDILKENDLLQLYLSDELLSQRENKLDFANISDEINIIYEDENLILINKEVGLVVHEDDENNTDTLINRVKSYLYKKGEYDPEKEQSFAPSLCNRLDRNTSGIVITAKNSESLRIINEKIKYCQIYRYYKGLVYGVPKPKFGEFTAYLQRDMDVKKVHISAEKTSTNLEITTKYQLLETISSASILQIQLITGRTHQIRAHLSYLGYPIIGDEKYGNSKINQKYGFKSQALTAYKIKFNFKNDGGILNYLDGKEFEINDVWFLKRLNSFKNEITKS